MTNTSEPEEVEPAADISEIIADALISHQVDARDELEWASGIGDYAAGRILLHLSRRSSLTPGGGQSEKAGDEDAWRKPPPHFKADPRWQRQPQSVEEWDLHKDTDHQFNAKRRLAFASDLADPRAPRGMALVSRWDVTTVLGRLTWLEARFENTSETLLPPPQPAGQSDRERALVEAMKHCLPRCRENHPYLCASTPSARGWAPCCKARSALAAYDTQPESKNHG